MCHDDDWTSAFITLTPLTLSATVKEGLLKSLISSIIIGNNLSMDEGGNALSENKTEKRRRVEESRVTLTLS